MFSLAKLKFFLAVFLLSQMMAGMGWAQSMKISLGHRLVRFDREKDLAVAQVSIDGQKAVTNFKDGSTKTITIPKTLENLDVEGKQKFITTVLNAYADMKTNDRVGEEEKYLTPGLVDELSGMGPSDLDPSGITTAAEALVSSTIYNQIGVTYVDISMDTLNAQMADTFAMIDSMVMNYTGEEWDNWKSGGLTPDPSDTESTSGTVTYEDGSTVSYTEDANGVRTYTYTDSEGNSYTTDNDQDDNGYPDDNNDGGFDWPFSNNITDRSERRGRFS